MTTMSARTDQAALPIFRVLLGVQAVATIVFGVIPLVIPGTFASVTGYTGQDLVIYRLAGAATTGYLVAALAALVSGRTWAELRIPIAATLTFTVAAAIGCATTIAGGDNHWVVLVVLVAAAAFAVLAAYWLRRNEGPEIEPGSPITDPWRVVIALATLSAAVFGLMPLVATGAFASVFGLAGSDAWIFRMAGSACFGYAVAGVLELRAPGYRPIAVQNLAAITFNALGAIAAIGAIVGGGGGLLAPVIAIAASFFTIALAYLAIRSR